MNLSDFHDILSDALELGEGKDLPQIEVTGVNSDSREVSPGEIFVALQGVNTNGAQYAISAVEIGARLVICGPDAALGELNVPVLHVPDPHRTLALLAAAFYGPQPETIVAVTGTAGKTSVAAFVRQIYAFAGHSAASIGTTGIERPAGHISGSLTTPDPVVLHVEMRNLSAEGVTHVAMEASSHGLTQRRLDGVKLAAAAFTNLGRDHMDYHPTVEDYLSAKMRLFDTLMDAGKPAIIFADDPYSDAAIEAARGAGLNVLTVGRRGEFLTLKRVEHERHRQIAEIECTGSLYRVVLPLAGDFQIANALVAAGLCIATGVEPSKALAALQELQGAPGRLEHVDTTGNGALVYVDYAHKPEALEQVLLSVRPFTTSKVVVVFGCGGDRDPGKRPIMGEIASRLADIVYVTDDNPRTEDAASIRSAIMEAALDAVEIGDRREAIRTAISLLEPGDTLVIAGKGHETGQTVNGVVHPFSDHVEARAAVTEVGPSAILPLWTGQEMVEAMHARPFHGMPEEVTGISIDSRTLKPGDAFFAIKGENMDGHNYTTAAAAAGASVLVVNEAKLPSLGRLTVPLMVVDDVLVALEKLGRAARKRSKAKIIAVTGSAGKTTTKDTLAHVLAECGKVHASKASFNNHWGVPLTLARMHQDTEYGVFEIGMNHAGEITPLVDMVRPHIAMVTLVAAAHMGHFKSLDDIARAKAEIFSGLVKGGVSVINRDDKRFKLLSDMATSHGVKKICGYGANRLSDVVLRSAEYGPDSSQVDVKVFGKEYSFELGLPGKHVVQNTLGVLGACALVGADLEVVTEALASLEASTGRGQRYKLAAGTGSFTLIDESYNANPASMEVGIEMLANTATSGKGRRIAVLGDMLEMGKFSSKLHAELVEPLERHKISEVYMAGPEMAHLKTALPREIKGHYFDDADALKAQFLKVPTAGDVVMIKSSNGIGFSKIVKALLEKYKAA
ncbi:MAG: UDP-N-acetylmuramoyl-L-alanyl-D-glutamate--2,6-diaminopimelate ligase [Pseudomonadota bacterium]